MQFTTNKYTGDSIQTQTFICSDDNPYKKNWQEIHVHRVWVAVDAVVFNLSIVYNSHIVPNKTSFRHDNQDWPVLWYMWISKIMEQSRKIPSGNLSMSAAILFSGTLYSFISLHNCYNHNLILNILKMSALLFFYW